MENRGTVHWRVVREKGSGVESRGTLHGRVVREKGEWGGK